MHKALIVVAIYLAIGIILDVIMTLKFNGGRWTLGSHAGDIIGWFYLYFVMFVGFPISMLFVELKLRRENRKRKDIKSP